MRAVIMAGGEGSRLRPLTCDIPKPMVRLCGRPVLEYIFDLLSQNGFKNVDVTVRYLPDIITRYFEGGYKNLELRFVEEDIPLGTAGGVKNAYKGSEDILIISGDAICDFDLARAMKLHSERGADATVIVKKVADPREYGLVDIDENNMIKLFIEKPDYSQAISDLANTGVYVLSKSALDLIPKDKAFDFSKDLFPLMLKTGMKLCAVEESGYWCDIGDLDSYRVCQRDMLSEKVRCQIGDGRIENKSYISNTANVSQDATIEQFSVIDDGATILSGARVTESIVLKNAIIGEKARLTGAVVCTGASIKKKAMLFDGAVIGKNAIVGEKATVMSSVKIWPYKELPIGTVASENIKTSSKKTELFSEEGICGEVGTELTPELAARLGAAVGSLGIDNIVVSAMQGSCSDMLKSAIMAGIQSSGATTIDIGTSSQGEFNFALCFLDSSLGIYISNTNETSIEILCEGGLPLNRAIERKLEGILSRGEFRRCNALSIGERVIIPEIRGFYHNMLMSEFGGLEGISAQIKSTSTPIRNEAITLIESMGGKTDSGDIYQIAAKGDKVSIYGKDIGYLPYRRVLALCCMTELSRAREISIPFDAPMAIDIMGVENGALVHRYLSCPSSDEDSYARQLAKNQLWSRDGLMMTIKLLSYLKREGISLSQMLERVPSFGTAVKTIRTEESTGELLRWLNSENKSTLGEGIILNEKRGTVLIKPMKRGTGVRIYAEALRFETAFELCDDMSFYIKNKKNRDKV